MRTLDHIGIPTAEQRDGETFLEDARVHITDAAKSPNRIEWLRFEAGSPMPKMLQTIPHIAYRVDDLEAELRGKDVLVAPFSPMAGIRAAFIIEEGAPIELMRMA